ncbi:DeoR/GlpR family DNA-binding transcription regulator [Phytoactinopolyspora limicola]|uniref:DeoR/GlpR family DNA-binding transcription regulator n=1 Tax=Phytoactinopolyspora limicola TaxID=2715536 RepID=UPI00140C2458|nr:DeoR/GlpR family DNA-binding transcription regulator [Phytoactinopolyspora limicola]
MIPEERRQRIYDRLMETGAVRVSDLSKEFGASETTIRRDMARMEAKGVLERTHGGSILTRRMSSEPRYDDKGEREVAAKRSIGAAAAALVQPGESIFVNSGSTNLHVLRHLAAKEGVRVVTNNASALEAWREGNELVLSGGRYRPRSNSYVGPLAAHSIRSMYADRCFIGVDGISLRHGLTTPNESESEIAQLMIAGTLGAVVVVADHTKIGTVAQFVTASLERVSTLVTDRRLADDFEQALSELDVNVVYADEHEPGSGV